MNIDVPIAAAWSIPLAAVRSIALFASAPIFGHTAVPVRVRVAIGLLVALAIAPLGAAHATQVPESVAAIAATIVNEAAIGLSLGFGLRLVFAVFAPLGELISLHGGLGAANVLDPSSGASSGVLGVLLQWVGLMVFFAVEGHHQLLRGLAASFAHVPLGQALWAPESFGRIVDMGGSLFELTARLAAPVTAVMLVSNVGIGILGRAIPQLNLIALQLPAHIAVVLLVLGLAAGPFSESIAQALLGGSADVVDAVLGGR